jgi:allophanate hydrolase subunit 1
MTKIQLHFELLRPLDETLMERIAKAHTVYGIVRIEVAPKLDALMVEYDATRLNPMEVEAVLLKAGIPLRLKS